MRDNSTSQKLQCTTMTIPNETDKSSPCSVLVITFGYNCFGYNSPAAIAIELFKPSTGAASLLGTIKKKLFDLGEGFTWDGLAKWGCFRFFDQL